jgi:hypothetical protein
MADQKQTLKALRAEAKTAGVKNYSKLSRDFLLDAIKAKREQNNISDALNVEKHIVFDTTVPEAQGEPEPVPPVPTIPPPPLFADSPETKREKKESLSDCRQSKSNKTRKKKDIDAPKKERKTAGPNKWQLHVQAFRSEHPELSYKQAMIDAKTTYQA